METKNIINKRLHFSSKNLQRLLSILNQYGESRIIGGAIRDRILGVENQDIDIATTIHPKQVMEILQNANIKSIPTGIDYGTITCILDTEIFEVTTLRKDLQCFGRKATVEFCKNFKTDALRRDFTINALSYDYFTYKIYDYTGGYYDLLKRKVKFIGNANERIAEDYLRILRFFRFTSKYSNKIDTEGLEACHQLIHRMMDISKERIYKEIILLFATQNVAKIIAVMQEREILKYIFPNICFDYKILTQAKNTNLEPIELIGISMLNTDQKIIKSELKYLKFPNKLIKEIITILNLKLIIQQESLDFAIKLSKLENWYKQQIVIMAALHLNIPHNKYKDLITFYDRLDIPPLPINGNDLLEAGMRNEQIGAGMQRAKYLWIQSNFNVSIKDLLSKP